MAPGRATTVGRMRIVASTDEECYEETGSLCRWVYDQTDGNETLANLTDWFVDIPIRIVLVVVVAFVITRLARRWVKRLVAKVVAPDVSPTERLEQLGIEVPSALEPTKSVRRSARAESISVLLTSTIVVIVWTIATMMMLGIIGIDLAPLIAGAGIAGVALGFGAQTLVRDCIAGLFMMLEDQYGIGDWIDLGEASGAVEDISMRTTVLRGIDGTVWHVPNGVVQRVGNKSQLWSVALVDIDVAYDTDLAKAQEALLATATDVCTSDRFADVVLEEPEILGVEALGADGITLRLIVRVEPGAQWALQRSIREAVKHRFDTDDIEIPFPQRTVWMRATPGAESPG